MVDLRILASTPLLRSRQPRPHESHQSLHRGHGVHDVHRLSLLVLIAVFIDCLAGLEVRLRGRVDEGGEEVRDRKDGMCALEGVHQGLGVVEIGSDHLDALGGEGNGRVAVGIASDAADAPARFAEEGGDDGRTLGAGGADYGDEFG